MTVLVLTAVMAFALFAHWAGRHATTYQPLQLDP